MIEKGVPLDFEQQNGPATEENAAPRVVAMVLAAGQASRMAASGKHKLLATFGGVPLVRKSMSTVLRSQADGAVLVTGYRADDIERIVEGLDCRVIYNPDFATGMASSLKAGLAAVRAEADGILVMLADMPGIETDDLDRLIAAFRVEKGLVIVRAVCRGKRGNPVILPRSTFDAIAALEGEVGARPIIDNSGLRMIDIDVGEAALLDADTVEAIAAAGGVLTD